MPSKNLSILGHVPEALRAKLPNYEAVLPSVLTPLLLEETDDLTTVLGFISGAITFQELSEDESSKTFKGTIIRVEDIERKSNGFLLGRKARIVFEAPQKNGGIEEQSIDTGWTEFYGFDAHTEAFNIALSNTIVDIANDNIGVECYIRKVLITGVDTTKGDKVRFIGDLKPVEGAGSPKKTSGGGRSQAKSRSGKVTTEDFHAEAEEQKVSVRKFSDEDILDLLEAINEDDIKESAAIVADVFDIASKEVEDSLIEEGFDKNPLKAVIFACA